MNTQTWKYDQITASEYSLSSQQYQIAGPGLIGERSCGERAHRQNFLGMKEKATALLIIDEGTLTQRGSRSMNQACCPKNQFPSPPAEESNMEWQNIVETARKVVAECHPFAAWW